MQALRGVPVINATRSAPEDLLNGFLERVP